MFQLPRKSKSTSGSRGSLLMILSYKFLKFFHYPCFEVRESIADISTELPCLGDLESPGRLPVQQVLGGSGDCVFTIYVFEVRESFADIPTVLPCMGNLKNSGHLPVQEVFEVTQTFVPWQKCSKFISSRAKVARRSHDQRFIVNFIVMSRHDTSCHVMSRHATSCHAMSRHVVSRHVTPCHVISRHVTSCHVMSRHVMSLHVTSCHV